MFRILYDDCVIVEDTTLPGSCH